MKGSRDVRLGSRYELKRVFRLTDTEAKFHPVRKKDQFEVPLSVRTDVLFGVTPER